MVDGKLLIPFAIELVLYGLYTACCLRAMFTLGRDSSTYLYLLPTCKILSINSWQCGGGARVMCIPASKTKYLVSTGLFEFRCLRA